MFVKDKFIVMVQILFIDIHVYGLIIFQNKKKNDWNTYYKHSNIISK